MSMGQLLCAKFLKIVLRRKKSKISVRETSNNNFFLCPSYCNTVDTFSFYNMNQIKSFLIPNPNAIVMRASG